MKNVQTSWKIRRFLLFAITVFCMTIIWQIVGENVDTDVAITALKYSYWIIFSVIVIYIFGVVTDEQITRFLENKFNIKPKDVDNSD